MKAFGVLPRRDDDTVSPFYEVEIPIPRPNPREILVKVHAISVNPVDTKIRAALPQTVTEPRILGWDASGVVEAVGDDVSDFSPGDEVYYAGDVTKSGCNAEWHCVDERLVAHKPKTLDFAQAASLPLTSLTAWEGLVERMRMEPGKRILIIGGAGGVGSIAIQLAKWMGLHVTTTVSREQSQKWCASMGADEVLDHSRDLAMQCQMLGMPPFAMIANFFSTEKYWDFMGEWIAPMGQLLLIVEPQVLLRLGDPLKAKCVSIHWEFMFARSKFTTPCMAQQGAILRKVADLIDQGSLRHTMYAPAQKISCESLQDAHDLMKSGTAIGKHVLYF